MNIFSPTPSRTNAARSRAGFTMIELLIVITILGILATAVLSAINPIEQINRGRDTGTRSDAEQLLSAMERYNAFRGFPVWLESADPEDGATKLPLSIISADSQPNVNGTTDCNILDRLAEGGTKEVITKDPNDNTKDITSTVGVSGCEGTNELKSSFISRITTGSGSRDLFVYNRGNAGDSTYVCFVPQSGAFKDEASTRCNTEGGIPADLEPIQDIVCDTGGRDGTTDDDGKAVPASDSNMGKYADDGAAICLP